MDLPIGYLIENGKYRVTGRLGRGGMGDVYSAEHVGIGRSVAIKLIKAELAEEPSLLERFRLELESLGKLSHPNIISITDVGKMPDGIPFLVMERLEGRTLDAFLKTYGTINPTEAVNIIIQVLDAVGAAHELGIVHRDIKPPNIFLTENKGKKTVKVLDWGIVKIIEDPTPSSDEEASPESRRRPSPSKYPTAEGVILGTPVYAAPEQILCEKVDGRADLYSCGLVLYKMLAGKGPFDGLRGHDLLHAQVRDEPVPVTKRAIQHVPALFDMVLAKALAKAPERRYQTAQEFIDDLNGVVAPVSNTLESHEYEVHDLETMETVEIPKIIDHHSTDNKILTPTGPLPPGPPPKKSKYGTELMLPKINKGRFGTDLMVPHFSREKLKTPVRPTVPEPAPGLNEQDEKWIQEFQRQKVHLVRSSKKDIRKETKKYSYLFVGVVMVVMLVAGAIIGIAVHGH